MINNLFPEYHGGSDIAYYVACQLQGPERKTMRVISQEWKDLSDHTSKKCTQLAAKIVDFSLSFFQRIFSISFLIADQDENLSSQINSYSIKMKPLFCKEIENFSLFQKKEFLDRTALIDKERGLTAQIAREISHVAAFSLVEAYQKPSSIKTEPPKTSAEKLAHQDLTSWTNGVIQGTIWKNNNSVVINKLKNKCIERTIFSELHALFYERLATSYEENFSVDEQHSLLALRGRAIYRFVQLEIGGKLHKDAVLWIKRNLHI